MTNDLILILDRGDAPSLAALGLEPDPGRLLLWAPPRTIASKGAMRMVAHHVEAFGVARRLSSGQPVAEPAVGDSTMLLEAVAIALAEGCPKIIWPVHAGENLDAAAAAVQRTQLVASLAALEGHARIPAIDMPLLDLDDRQIADLLDDSGAPMRLFWPCTDQGGAEGSDAPCGSCSGCQRWQGAFAEARVMWPWGPDAVAAAGRGRSAAGVA